MILLLVPYIFGHLVRETRLAHKTIQSTTYYTASNPVLHKKSAWLDDFDALSRRAPQRVQ